MKRHSLLIALLLVGASTATAQQAAVAPAEEKAKQSHELAGGKLTFDAPSGWKEVPPKSRILEKELAIPHESADPGRLTIMAAGGSVQANLARWVGQFKETDGGTDRSEADQKKIEVDGMPATLLDVSGTYMQSTGGPFGPKTPQPDYRMIGAIVETGTSGNYFFKLIGPKATIDPVAKEFRTAIESLKKK